MIGTAQTPACDDLFDSVGQSIFGIGLLLEECLEAEADPGVREKLDATIQGLHAIIGRIRERGELHCHHEPQDARTTE